MRKGGIIAIIIIAVLIIAAVIGFVVYNNGQSGTTSTGGDVYQKSTGSNLGFEDDQSGLVREADAGIVIPGWKQMTIDADTTDVYVDFYNPEDNEGKYYLTFELKLADTGETLYTSKLVKPGDSLKKITLSRPLSAGTYNAVVHVQPYTADEAMTETNNLDIELILNVV